MMKELLHYNKVDTPNLKQQTSQYGNWYETCEFFMLRAPLLSINDYFNAFPQQQDFMQDIDSASTSFQSFMNNPIIRESILLASPSLIESLDDINKKMNSNQTGFFKKHGKVMSSLLRYFIRMTTRTTPFGLFSGVITGGFGEKSNLNLGSKQNYCKRVRPDMSWICKLVEIMENDDMLLDQLHVKTNHTTLLKGDRLKLIYRPQYGLNQENISVEETSSIFFSEVAKFVFGLTNKPVQVSVIKLKLKLNFPEANTETIDYYVKGLIKQEFLISELRPPLMDCSPLEYICQKIECLQAANSWYEKLNRIQKCISDYQYIPIGQGEKQYLKLSKMMNDIAKVKNPLQADLKLDKKPIIPSIVQKDVALGAELMIRLAIPETNPLEKYTNQFLEKYGVSKEVAITELFDEDWGLGIPEEYKSTEENYNRLQFSTLNRNRILFSWLNNAIYDGKIEICLTEEHIKQISMNDEYRKAPDSLEIYYSIHANDEAGLQRGEYDLVLGASAGSSGAGKTFGRFLDLFDSEFQKEFSKIHKFYEQLCPETILAEAVYLPRQARVANIMLSKNLGEYEIVSGTNSSKEEEYTLNIDELYVGVHQEKFYIKSKKLDREVIIMNTNMLNHKISPPIYRFMSDVSRLKFNTWSYFDWGDLEQSSFLPRLRYKNIIISSAQWKLGKDILGSAKMNDDWEKNFRHWREKWNLPRYIYMSMGDNRLLLDNHNPLHIAELKKEYEKLKDGQELLLVEHIGDIANSIVHSNGKKLMGEFVFPLLKKDSFRIPANIIPENKGWKNSLVEDTTLFPGSGSSWLYLKLYGIKEREKDIISLYLNDMLSQAAKQGWSQLAYFVRYVDPKPHLRIRFYGEPNQLWKEGLHYLYEWTGQLKAEGLITTIQIDTYIPEWERYGGKSLMRLAEQVFDIDSKLVTCLLRGLRNKQIKLDIRTIAVINICTYLKKFGLSIKEGIDWLDARVDSKAHINTYRSLKEELLNALKNYSDTSIEVHSQDNEQIENLYQEWTRAIQYYSQQIYDHFNERKITNNPEDILASIIHMHLNRLIGIQREQEIECMGLAKHVLANFLYRREAGL